MIGFKPTQGLYVLYPRSTSLLYQIGGGINANSYNQIYNLLEGVMK
mgnify:CR=1 FL=1